MLFTDLFSTLAVNKINIDIIIGIIISITLVLLGINEDYLDKQYQKKYLMVMYFILTNLIIYMQLLKINIFYKVSSLMIMAMVISAVNLAYNNDNLERRMSIKDLFIFKLFEWIFTIRLYMIWIYCIFLTIGIKLFVNLETFVSNYSYLNSIVAGLKLLFLFVIVSHIIKHLLHNAKDLFGFKMFDEVKKTFEDKKKKFNDYYDINKNNKSIDEIKKDKEIIEFIAFIIYMEDKDFFDRKRLFLSIKVIKKRKKKEKSKIKLKIENRGYSTIPQQAIRRICLTQNAFTHSTRFRRKLFIEHFYMVYFFKYYVLDRNKHIKSIYGNKTTYTLDMLKVDILKVYYEEVSKLATCKEELIISMDKNSGKPNYEQYFYYYKNFKKSESRKSYMLKIAKNYYRYGSKSSNNNINEKNTQDLISLISALNIQQRSD